MTTSSASWTQVVVDRPARGRRSSLTDLLVDTSVAVPLLLASHEAHGRVESMVGDRGLALAGHALVETYAVLTRLPGDARLEPGDASRLLDLRFRRPVVLDAAATRSAPSTLAALGVAGGATYDALIGLAARRAGMPLASRDRRAEATYRLVGAEVEMFT